mmetsp:Transcript_13412/g.34796  ORF Transcript_13412/g.34796 Transcript_13412/m.34796 type:complete len:466 (-) Transcript_13412:473-1870(-)
MAEAAQQRRDRPTAACGQHAAAADLDQQGALHALERRRRRARRAVPPHRGSSAAGAQGDGSSWLQRGVRPTGYRPCADPGRCLGVAHGPGGAADELARSGSSRAGGEPCRRARRNHHRVRCAEPRGRAARAAVRPALARARRHCDWRAESRPAERCTRPDSRRRLSRCGPRRTAVDCREGGVPAQRAPDACRAPREPTAFDALQGRDSAAAPRLCRQSRPPRLVPPAARPAGRAGPSSVLPRARAPLDSPLSEASAGRNREDHRGAARSRVAPERVADRQAARARAGRRAAPGRRLLGPLVSTRRRAPRVAKPRPPPAGRRARRGGTGLRCRLCKLQRQPGHLAAAAPCRRGQLIGARDNRAAAAARQRGAGRCAVPKAYRSRRDADWVAAQARRQGAADAVLVEPHVEVRRRQREGAQPAEPHQPRQRPSGAAQRAARELQAPQAGPPARRGCRSALLLGRAVS